VQVALPFLFAALDYALVRRHQKSTPDEDKQDLSAYEAASDYLLHSPLRHLVATALYGISSFIVQKTAAPVQSTYICPVASNLGHIIPHLQHFGVLTDFCIAYFSHSLMTGGSSSKDVKGLGKSFTAVGSAFLVKSRHAYFVLRSLTQARLPPSFSGWRAASGFLLYLKTVTGYSRYPHSSSGARSSSMFLFVFFSSLRLRW